MTTWKRGLLKAWLALSLLWAAGLTWWSLSWTVEVFAGSGGGFFAVAVVAYLLPLGALPPLALLALGALVFWIIERLRGT